jgi:hypothetical protein
LLSGPQLHITGCGLSSSAFNSGLPLLSSSRDTQPMST